VDTDAMMIAVRFALYLDLMLVFGLPLFCLYTFKVAEQRFGREVLSSTLASALSLAGVGLSVIGLLLLTASMSDVTIGQLDRDTILTVLNQTAAGTAGKIRIAALIATLLVMGLVRSKDRLRWWLLSALGATALGSLAWTGHGAADEGVVGNIHLGADIAHLLAAGTWVGALVGLLALLVEARAPMRGQPTRIAVAHEALVSFGKIGTLAVATIMLTGLVNSWLLVGVDNARALLTSLYGRLLILKLIVFIGMLGLAARNRFSLTPAIRVDGATAFQEPGNATRPIIRSVAFEAVLALVVLGLVAWLGTLSPPASGM
jgi:putative copper resistance protein D